MKNKNTNEMLAGWKDDVLIIILITCCAVAVAAVIDACGWLAG